jgi:hypothetical protein
MEVAGTAVGVASLGITVCQGLVEYYGDWEGYEDDICKPDSGINNLSKSFAFCETSLKYYLTQICPPE